LIASTFAPVTTPANADFELCNTTGWTITGSAFSVSSATTWWGGTYDQHGTCFLSGYLGNADTATGTATSATFTATDQLSFLIAGGYDPANLNVELVRATDGAVLDRQTGDNSEQLARITWDTTRVRGQLVYLEAVDTATGSWGHLNLDDVRTSAVDDAGNGLTSVRLGSANEPTAGPARARYAVDPLRPQYHYTPYQGWINDPVGLSQWQSRYQLFAQFNPASPFWGPMHWAHAQSPDDVHWTGEPVALTPPPPATPSDTTGEWSGSAIDDNGVLTLFYTHYTDTGAHPGATDEQIYSATSTDGVTFTPSAANPVIAGPPANSEAGFRDPKVFRDPHDGQWKMVVGSGNAGIGQVLLYSSPDLRSWTYRGVLYSGDPSEGSMWECPTLIQVDGRWVLTVSTNGGVHYFVGDFTGSAFTANTSGQVDYGPNFYAAQAFTDASGRALLVGWMNNGGAFDLNRLDGWSQSETITRQLSIEPDGSLGTQPIAAVDSLHTGTPAALGTTTITSSAPIASGSGLDIHTGFDVSQSAASTVGLDLMASSAEKTVLSYDPASQLLTLDTTASGYGQGSVSQVKTVPDAQGQLHLRVLTDRSTIEVFTGDGRSLTARVYPRYTQSTGASAFATGGSAVLLPTTVWRMGSAW
jgi:sucrose-6-phosphate hydrolase SacC (GH32 family)